jgi:hypothetical protein
LETLGKLPSVISASQEPTAATAGNNIRATTFFVKIPHFLEFSLLGYRDYGLEVGFFP